MEITAKKASGAKRWWFIAIALVATLGATLVAAPKADAATCTKVPGSGETRCINTQTRRICYFRQFTFISGGFAPVLRNHMPVSGAVRVLPSSCRGSRPPISR